MPNQNAEQWNFEKLHFERLPSPPPTPDANELAIYADDTTGLMHQIDEAGASLPLSGGGGGGGGSELVAVACTEQLAINNGGVGADSGLIGDTHATFGGNNFMRFPLSGFPESVTRAFLRFVILNNANCLGGSEGVNAFIRAQRVARTDLNYAQATWTLYKTGSSWNTAGGFGRGSDYDEDHVAWLGPYPNFARVFLATGAMVQWEEIDVTSMVNEALALALSQIDIAMWATATGGHNKFTIASRTDGTAIRRPTLLYA